MCKRVLFRQCVPGAVSAKRPQAMLAVVLVPQRLQALPAVPIACVRVHVRTRTRTRIRIPREFTLRLVVERFRNDDMGLSWILHVVGLNYARLEQRRSIPVKRKTQEAVTLSLGATAAFVCFACRGDAYVAAVVGCFNASVFLSSELNDTAYVCKKQRQRPPAQHVVRLVPSPVMLFP